MKCYTDIEQSKKLADILPIDTADMWYSYYGNSKYNPTIAYEGQQWFLCQIRNSLHDDIPCWSLSALLSILPVTATLLKDGNISDTGDVKYSCECSMVSIYKWFDNPVDACVAMIEKLNELNLL